MTSPGVNKSPQGDSMNPLLAASDKCSSTRKVWCSDSGACYPWSANLAFDSSFPSWTV